jgi:hypothetical protein
MNVPGYPHDPSAAVEIGKPTLIGGVGGNALLVLNGSRYTTDYMGAWVYVVPQADLALVPHPMLVASFLFGPREVALEPQWVALRCARARAILDEAIASVSAPSTPTFSGHSQPMIECWWVREGGDIPVPRRYRDDCHEIHDGPCKEPTAP